MLPLIQLIRRIIRLSGKYAKQIRAAFVFSALKSLLSQMPVFVAFLVLVSFYEKTMTVQKCIYAGISLFAIVALEAGAHLMSDRLQSAAGYLMFADKRMELGAHLKKMPMGYFTAGNIGKISSVLSTDMTFVEEVCMSTIADMMSYIFHTAVMLVFLFGMDIRMGLLMLAFTLLVSLAAERMNRISIREGAIRQEQSEKLTDAVLSYTEGIGIIKSYNLLGEKSKELSGNFRESKETALGFERKLTPWHLLLFFIYGTGTAVLLGTGICLEQRGELSLPWLFGLLLFLFNFFEPQKALYAQATRLTVMSSCLDRLERVFAEPELPDDGKKHLPERGGDAPEISFEHVTFAYGKEDVVRDVSFSVEPDTMTALVGPSGSGKSTLACLLTRFWDVKSGAVRFRGVDVREVPLAELMNEISMVFQRVYLFRDTVYNNISMGKPDASREEVYEAARRAGCYDFIMQLEQGFDTVIGEGGATLSGGEKQRISIARCILKDAPVIILDEATASVDPDNERCIQQAISELVKGKTLLVIAHRLNTIRSADRILVVDDGAVVQSGTHEGLMQEEGIYQNFVVSCFKNIC